MHIYKLLDLKCIDVERYIDYQIVIHVCLPRHVIFNNIS